MPSYPYQRLYVTLALLGLAALLAGVLTNCYRWSDTAPVPPKGALLVKHGPFELAAHILAQT